MKFVWLYVLSRGIVPCDTRTGCAIVLAVLGCTWPEGQCYGIIVLLIVVLLSKRKHSLCCVSELAGLSLYSMCILSFEYTSCIIHLIHVFDRPHFHAEHVVVFHLEKRPSTELTRTSKYKDHAASYLTTLAIIGTISGITACCS